MRQCYLFTLIIHRPMFDSISLFHPSGAAYAHAEDSIKDFIDRFSLPFLPSPMGKGVVPDDDPHCVNAARSRYGSSLCIARSLR